MSNIHICYRKEKRNEKDVDKRNVSCFPTKVQPHSVTIIIYRMAAQSRQKVRVKDTDIGLHVFQRKKPQRPVRL